MKVVAFVGPSGTGKSHRAIGIAHKNNCDAIIDDGLLIKGTKILAGTSAKNETNRIQRSSALFLLKKIMQKQCVRLWQVMTSGGF